MRWKSTGSIRPKLQNVNLNLKIMIHTNEMPHLRDTSMALASGPLSSRLTSPLWAENLALNRDAPERGRRHNELGVRRSCVTPEGRAVADSVNL